MTRDPDSEQSWRQTEPRYRYRLDDAADKLSALTDTVYIGSGSGLVSSEVVVKQM